MQLVDTVMAYGAAKASESAIFIPSAHVAVQRVLHDVRAIEFMTFDIRDGKHADQHGGQWKVGQNQHVYDLIK